MALHGCKRLGHGRRSGRRGASTQVLVGSLFVIGLLVGVFFVWQRYGARIMSEEDYVLTAEGIEISTVPDWIRADIKQQAIREASFQDLSMRQPGLTVEVAQAFAMQPWVSRVVRVSKSFPGRVQVELEYRRPVGFVEVPDGNWAIDAEGCLLPSEDFLDGSEKPTALAETLPRIYARDASWMGTYGAQWGDPRIHRAAKLAEVLLPVWQELNLYRIVAIGAGEAEYGGQRHAQFVIYTPNSTGINWGAAPGYEKSGEPKADVKIKRLKELVAKSGPLEQIGQDGRIDLTQPDGVHVTRLKPPPGIDISPINDQPANRPTD